VALRSTQPLTEMSTRNLPGVKDGRRVRLTTSTPSVSHVDASKSHKLMGLHGLVTGIALPFNWKPAEFADGRSVLSFCRWSDPDFGVRNCERRVLHTQDPLRRSMVGRSCSGGTQISDHTAGGVLSRTLAYLRSSI
jgi:hypothetical protein